MQMMKMTGFKSTLMTRQHASPTVLRRWRDFHCARPVMVAMRLPTGGCSGVDRVRS